jgi:hypothetical protein
MYPGQPSDLASDSADGERDRDGLGDPLLPGADPATASEPRDGEWAHSGAGCGERTADAGGVCVVLDGGHRESNGSLGDVGWERDGDGHRDSNGSLGDVGWERDGNTDVSRLDVGAACAHTEPGCAIGPASAAAGCASALEEAGTGAGPPFLEEDL